MAQIKIKNEKVSGVCKQCGENSNRILTPPLILPPDWGEVTINGDEASWMNSDGIWPYPTDFYYSLVFDNGMQFLRPQGITNDPVCWLCFIKFIVPECEYPFIVNKPDQFVLVSEEFMPPTVRWSE
jgi:hypothetical protein